MICLTFSFSIFTNASGTTLTTSADANFIEDERWEHSFVNIFISLWCYWIILVGLILPVGSCKPSVIQLSKLVSLLAPVYRCSTTTKNIRKYWVCRIQLLSKCDLSRCHVVTLTAIYCFSCLVYSLIYMAGVRLCYASVKRFALLWMCRSANHFQLSINIPAKRIGSSCHAFVVRLESKEM